MPQTIPTTSLTTVSRLARRSATAFIAAIALSLAAAGCATDEPLPAAPPPAVEQPAETVVSDDSAEPAVDDGLDPAPTTTFVADDSPVEVGDTSGDAGPDPETAPVEPPTATPDEEVEAPVTTIPAAAVTTVPAEPCPDGTHPDDSGGCHPYHDDVTTTTVTPTTTTVTPTTTTVTPTTTTVTPTTTTVTPTTTTVTPTTTTVTPTTTTVTPTTTTVTPTTTTVTPDEDDPWERAKYEPVLASELYPDEEYPDNMWCEWQDDNTVVGCWIQPELEYDRLYADEWVPPVAAMVPAVHPDTPPPAWDRGEAISPGSRPIETPRATGEDREVVAEWINWADGLGGYAEWLLFNMKWSLDYLGAHPNCVISEYYDRTIAAPPGRAEPYSFREQHGWHNCATVIDPHIPGVQLPQDRTNDVGLRLSDTGITLAERCRVVLPADIQLEKRWLDRFDVENRTSIYYQPEDYYFEAGHAGCDAWAAWVQSLRHGDTHPRCRDSAWLAAEWLEHYRGRPETSFPVTC